MDKEEMEGAGEEGVGKGEIEESGNPPEASESGADELEKLRAEKNELVEDLKRLQAEFENYQKRSDREKAEFVGRGRKEILGKLIGFADEFDAASEHMHKSSESELRNGIRLLHKKLLALLEEEDVRPIECVGRKFDSNMCEAIEVVEDEGEEGLVLKEIRKGYAHGGGVLRHSLVAVSKRKKNDD